MEGCENTERRYNTRFRGIPRSIFTYARVGKKPGPKPNNTSSLNKNDLSDDFVYTKLGRKPSTSVSNSINDQYNKNKDPKQATRLEENGDDIGSIGKRELWDDFVYTKLGKKPRLPKYSSNEKNDVKLEGKGIHAKEEKKIFQESEDNSNSKREELDNSCTKFERKICSYDCDSVNDNNDLLCSKFRKKFSSPASSIVNESHNKNKNVEPTLKSVENGDSVGILVKKESLSELVYAKLGKKFCLQKEAGSAKNNAKIEDCEIQTEKGERKVTSQSTDNNTCSSPKKEVPDGFLWGKFEKKFCSYNCDSANEICAVKTECQDDDSNQESICKSEIGSNPMPNGLHFNKNELCDLQPNEEESDKEDDDEVTVIEPASSTVGDTNTGSISVWIMSKERLSFNNSNVASYNPKTKMFRCVVCQAVGFMSRIGEHYLGTHCNVKVFHCPQCTYSSAWWRCVRNHMNKNHGVFNAPASMWKNQPLLDEIMQLLQNLKYSVDCQDRVVRVSENSGKRYICPKCPYATDRRDLYNRHENIHREEKPFQCYICYKLFNRADHVKKHFCRIHKDYDYDINLIRRLPSKRSRIPVSPSFNGMTNSPNMDIRQPNNTTTTTLANSSKTPMSNNSVPFTTQSHLLNCLIGNPPVKNVMKEAEPVPNLLKSAEPVSSATNVPKSHGSLMSFLTQSSVFQKSKDPPPQLIDSVVNAKINHFVGEIKIPPPVGCLTVDNNEPKKYYCPYCPWKGMDTWTLRLHVSTHFKTYSCMLCDYKSTQETNLEIHLWETHRKRSCSKCNFLADSIIILDSHMKEVHDSKHQFTCRHCSQPFEVRSDMEAHCIFIHNQVLQECKQDGCDFCTTDPGVLERHRQEKHCLPSVSQETKSASNNSTLCLYCGCDFADSNSLTIHLQLFHENPLQLASKRALDPYCCSVCGHSTPSQQMMMEHMRIHSGQVLHCQAGDGCYFRTPYDSVLREHILQTHSLDDGIVRCPHCGYPCSSQYSFVSHYQEHHHPFICQLCEEVEHKHFSLSNSFCSSSSAMALFPFSKQQIQLLPKVLNGNEDVVENLTLQENLDVAKEVIGEDSSRRSRKQLQPRKVLQGSRLVNTTSNEGITSVTAAPLLPPPKANIRNCHSNSVNRVNNFISLYAKKVRSLAQSPLLKCKFCIKCPLYFRHRKNHILHSQWHCLKKHHCSKCIQTFRHRYQVLLHQRKDHKKELS